MNQPSRLERMVCCFCTQYIKGVCSCYRMMSLYCGKNISLYDNDDGWTVNVLKEFLFEKFLIVTILEYGVLYLVVVAYEFFISLVGPTAIVLYVHCLVLG